MKKSLIALSVLVATNSVNAAEIYAEDGMSLNLAGEAEVQYLQSQTQDADPEINIETATLSADFSYEVSEALEAGGYYEIDGSGSTASVSNVYVYFVANDSSTLSVGRQSTIFDDAGIGDDYAFGFSSFIDQMTTSGDEVIKYKYDAGEVMYAGIAYVMNKGGVEDDYQVDGNIGARLTDFDFTLFAAQSEVGEDSENNYAFEARYALGYITLAATYGYTDTETNGVDNQIDIVGMAATYDDGGRWSYAAGWANVDDESASEDVNDVYVNAAYWITDNANVYAEVGLTDADDQDTGYVLGMDVNF